MFRKFIFRVLPPIFALISAACSGSAVPATPEVTASPTTDPAQITSPLPSPTAALASTNTPGCSVVSEAIAPEPPAGSPYPPVSEADWAQGPANATVTLVEYGDFQ